MGDVKMRRENIRYEARGKSFEIECPQGFASIEAIVCWCDAGGGWHREVSGGFDTVTMLTDRSQFTKAVQKALTKKWKGIGLTVEQVSVQDIRYPKNITKSYSEAQAAEVAKQKAQNEQETAKVQAETKKIEAQGEADANAVLANSLNDQVLQQHYIDALKSIGKDGNLVVVPEGSQPIVGTK